MAKKINETRINRALKNWSPNGLCGGALVQKNGDPKKTEACAVGCMALEFIHSKPGKRYFVEKKIDTKKFVERYLYDEATIGNEAFNVAMRSYYGISPEVEGEVMSFNDRCLQNGKEADNRFSMVPLTVRRTVRSLRKKFEKFEKKRDAQDAKDRDTESVD